MLETRENTIKMKRRTLKRLKGFDYKKPYHYMVTLTRLKGLRPFSEITQEKEPLRDVRGRVRYLISNELTQAFTREIRSFHLKWHGLWQIKYFIIMPDHVHLVMRLKGSEDQLVLGSYVYRLMHALAVAYWSVEAPPLSGKRSGKILPIFEHDWHDWIVKKHSQLTTFVRYIYENPERSWLRKQNKAYFGMVRKVTFLGCEWFAYGNTAILDLPILKAVKGHRATQPGSAEWDRMIDDCSRIGPIGAGVGTFMSPLEKACGNAIAMTGGKWVVLTPEGFHDRWHPGRRAERYCAEGRVLFLSLYPAMDRLPTKAELYHRCHEMGDIVVNALSRVGE